MLNRTGSNRTGAPSASDAPDVIRFDAPASIAADTIRAPHIIDARSTGAGYLSGQCLVATQLVTGSCFQRSVVYIFQHNDDGAMGLIINQPLERVRLATLLETTGTPHPTTDKVVPVYFGGPVEKTRGFVLHSADYMADFTLMRHGDIAITASNAILSAIAADSGPRHAQLCIGYAGWQAGQLENEIAENSWITVPATTALLFGTEDDLKWATAGKSLGVDMSFYSASVGHA